jgi:hypothetical protein
MDTAFFWNKLLRYIDEGHVIPIVGPDLLCINAGGKEQLFHPWLSGRVARVLGFSDEIEWSLSELASRTVARDGQLEDLYYAIAQALPPRGEIDVPTPLRKIAEIRSFKLFITTTFDTLLLQAIDHVRFGGARKTRSLRFSVTDPDDLPTDYAHLTEPVVYHLFGRYSAIPDYGVTEEDTLEFVHALQSEVTRPRLLFDALNSEQLLVLGATLKPWVSRFFIRLAKPERLWFARRKRDILVGRSAAADAELVDFLNHFSRYTDVFGQDAVQFVDELHTRWTEAHVTHEPSPSPDPRVDQELPDDCVPGAIFLSYASEDRDVVGRIDTRLKQAGLDTWFDRSQLEGGDRWRLKIKENIERCSLFLPIISCHSLSPRRRFFREEWSLALEQSRMASPDPALPFILPIVVDDTRVDAPALRPYFEELQWHRVVGGDLDDPFVTRLTLAYRQYQKAMAT